VGKCYSEAELRKWKPDKGLLSGYPILELIKGHLDDSMIRDLLAFTGHTALTAPPRVAAFGQESIGGVIRGWASFSDACRLAHASQGGMVMVMTPYYI
jgi:hypothetical protein